MSNRKTKLPDFEASMKELETLVEQLERGDLPLEEALKQFERGVALTRACQSALKEAEQKVEILLSPTDRSDAAEDASPPEGAVAGLIVSAAAVTITEFEPES